MKLVVDFGRSFFLLETLWICAWLGISIWFNIEPDASGYEQTLFDCILRSICAYVGIMFVVTRAQSNVRKSKRKALEWWKPFIFWLSVFIMVRCVVQTYRAVPGGGVLNGKDTRYGQALQAFAISGLIVSVLELSWILFAMRVMNEEEWSMWPYGILGWFAACLPEVRDGKLIWTTNMERSREMIPSTKKGLRPKGYLEL